MPETIALIATFAAAYVGGGVVVSTAVFYGVAGALYAGLSIGASLLQNALMAGTRPPPPKPDDVQTNIRQSTPVRAALYGWGKLGGPWVFGESASGDFYRVVALSSRKLSAIVGYWLNDTKVELDESGGVLTNPWWRQGAPAVYMRTRLGEPVETVYQEVIDAFPEYWTPAHRGDGVASLMSIFRGVKAEQLTEFFPNVINTQTTVEAAGVAVFDPADPAQDIETPSTWQFSDNAACAIMDYLWHRDGMRLPVALLTTPEAMAGWRQAAEDCADPVNLKDGGAEHRYRLWGIYRYDERPADVLARFLACCDGALAPTPDGGLTINIGKWREPTVTIDSSMIVAQQEVGRGRNILQTANTIYSQFTSAPHGYQATDADPWSDDDDVGERGEISVSTDFVCAPSHSQCRRLMKVAAHRANPDWVGTFICNLKALPAMGERWVRLDYPELGIVGTFEVLKIDLIFGEHSTLRHIAIALQSMPASAYAWSPALEEGTAPAFDRTVNDGTLPIPTGVVVEAAVHGSTLVGELTWDAPPAASVKSEARGKLSSDDAWTSLTVTDDVYYAEMPLDEGGEEYEFQVRYLSLSGRPGDWSPSVTVIAAA